MGPGGLTDTGQTLLPIENHLPYSQLIFNRPSGRAYSHRTCSDSSWWRGDASENRRFVVWTGCDNVNAIHLPMINWKGRVVVCGFLTLVRGLAWWSFRYLLSSAYELSNNAITIKFWIVSKPWKMPELGKKHSYFPIGGPSKTASLYTTVQKFGFIKIFIVFSFTQQPLNHTTIRNCH